MNGLAELPPNTAPINSVLIKDTGKKKKKGFNVQAIAEVSWRGS